MTRATEIESGPVALPGVPSAIPVAPPPTWRDLPVEQAARALEPLLRALGNRRDFAVRFWDGRGFRAPAGVTPRFTLVIRRPGALRRMLLPPTDLAIGEAFVHGDFDVEGDIFSLVSLPDRLGQLALGPMDWLRLALRLSGLSDSAPAATDRSPADLSGELHSAERDSAAIRFHYDVGNDFYRTWLDERMVYSCAYFRTDDATLDDAQLAKLDLVLDKLQIRDGMRLLDVGCGWGGLLMRAVERFPQLTAVGITLAQRQHELARQRIEAAGLSDRIRVELMDYRDAPARLGRFDRIASIGMAEHVGERQMPDYFAAARDCLEPGGLFLNHAITAQPARTAPAGGGLLPGALGRAMARRSFIDAYVFPDGELLTLPQMLASAQAAGFEVVHVESLRPHYARTLRHWVERLESHWSEAVTLQARPSRAPGGSTWPVPQSASKCPAWTFTKSSWRSLAPTGRAMHRPSQTGRDRIRSAPAAPRPPADALHGRRDPHRLPAGSDVANSGGSSGPGTGRSRHPLRLGGR